MKTKQQKQLACFNRRIKPDTFVKHIPTGDMYQTLRVATIDLVSGEPTVLAIHTLRCHTMWLSVDELETYDD